MFWGWSILYAGLTGACALTVLAACRHERNGLYGLPAAMAGLIFTWLATNLSIAWLGPYHMLVYPPLDGAFAFLLALQWRGNRQWWAFALACFFGLELNLHGLYFLGAEHGYAARYGYDLSLNVIYVAQLCCVWTPAILKILTRRGAISPAQ